MQYLADARLEGRATGSAGEQCAREYIAAQFGRLGLSPAGDAGTFFQSVTVWGKPLVPPANVIALLPGTDSGHRAEAIVLGAHHDHLGRDSTGTVYPGADDNASGVAALLRVAEILAADPPSRSVVFVTFTAEESMMFGSEHYVEHPVRPLEKTLGMINLDMVGRLGEQPLQISGLSTDPGWLSVLSAANVDAIAWELKDEVEKGSDHLPFHRAGVPNLYLKTGRHSDYHQPSDTAEKVDVEGLEKIARLVANLVRAHAEAAPLR